MSTNNNTAYEADELGSAVDLFTYIAQRGSILPAPIAKAPTASKPAPSVGANSNIAVSNAKSSSVKSSSVPSQSSASSVSTKAPKESKAAPVPSTATPVVIPEVPRRRRQPLSGTKLPKSNERNILITSALPYVNNVPHLGNIIGCVLSADVYARYCRGRKLNAIYICGTDEYGTATEAKAQEEGLTPRAICDKYHVQHKAIYDWFDISFDHFGRTSTSDPWKDPNAPHTQRCQEIFLDNLANNNLIEQSMEQVFCLQCNKFLADRFIEGNCPHCQYDDARGDQCDKCGKVLNATELLNPRCKFGRDLGHKVEVRSSTHLFLDLPKLEPRLREWVEKSSTEGEWTTNSVQITTSWIRDGLKPRCITRDLRWGVPVPHEHFQNKVFYVWFDAPIGYISITSSYTDQWKQWWQNPSQVKLYQFMGKDNIPFHTVIFPSSLLGSGRDWTLLHHVSTTEYLNYESGKFSKSRGVGVFGDTAQSTGIPSEVWRYYLLAIRPEASDSVFSWSDFASKNNDELLKNIGNLVNRTLNFAFANFNGTIPPLGTLIDIDQTLIKDVNTLLTKYNNEMDKVHLKAGLQTVMAISSQANKYLQDTAPWELKKTNPERCATVISLASSLIRLIATIMEPFMPGFTDKVAHILNLDHMDIPDTFEPSIPPNHPLSGKPQPLFTPITEEQIALYRAQFGGTQAEAEAAANASNTGAPASIAKDGKGKAKGSSAAPSNSPKVDLSNLPDIAKVDLRVGKILRAWPHPEADKLWCEEVDVGEDKPRMIASGLRQYYTQDQMTGRTICVVCNLKPRPMVGFESQGMVLCAANADRSVVEFIDPPSNAKIGERLTLPGVIPADAPFPVPEIINPAKKNNPWTAIASDLRTDSGKVATYKGTPFTTSAGVCTAPTQSDAPIS